MKDENINLKIQQIKDSVLTINDIMTELHDKNVEIRFVYREIKDGKPAKLEIYRATEHIDYLAGDNI